MNNLKKRTHFMRILLFVLTLFLSFTYRGEAQEENDPYIIGTDTTFAPFEFVDESGEMVGIDIDLLDAIAEDQGFDYELQVLGFNAAVQALESNQVDGVHCWNEYYR